MLCSKTPVHMRTLCPTDIFSIAYSDESFDYAHQNEPQTQNKNTKHKNKNKYERNDKLEKGEFGSQNLSLLKNRVASRVCGFFANLRLREFLEQRKKSKKQGGNEVSPPRHQPNKE